MSCQLALVTTGKLMLDMTQSMIENRKQEKEEIILYWRKMLCVSGQIWNKRK